MKRTNEGVRFLPDQHRGSSTGPIPAHPGGLLAWPPCACGSFFGRLHRTCPGEGMVPSGGHDTHQALYWPALGSINQVVLLWFPGHGHQPRPRAPVSGRCAVTARGDQQGRSAHLHPKRTTQKSHLIKYPLLCKGEHVHIYKFWMTSPPVAKLESH